MTQVTIGNHTAVRVPRAERDRIQRFYCDVLGGTLVRAGLDKDDVRLGSFYFAFLYEEDGVALDAQDFLRAIFLELSASDAGDLRQRIVDFGVVVLDVPDPHLYFQAPGGQVFRLVAAGEDLSKYEGTSHGEANVGNPYVARRASP